MEIRLPKIPKHISYKKCAPGIDLPRSFIDDLKSLDIKLYPVWHKYETLWETPLNEYTGPANDPRLALNYDFNTLNFGYVLKNPDNSPKLDCSWHVWRFGPHGWEHVTKLLSTDPGYLRLFVYRLHLQDKVISKYGAKKYVKMLHQKEEELRESEKKDLMDMHDAVQKENSWLLNAAMDNFSRGVITPNRPKKEIVTSYAGQKNRTKIVRGITDEEGGLWVPPELKRKYGDN